MTLNNLDENLTWLLANVAIIAPNSPPLPSAAAGQGPSGSALISNSKPGITPPSNPGNTATPAATTLTLATVRPQIPQWGASSAVGPQLSSLYRGSLGTAQATDSKLGRSLEGGAEDGNNARMGRLLPSSVSRKRTLMVNPEQQLLTPTSTKVSSAGPGPLYQSYRAQLSRTESADAASATPGNTTSRKVSPKRKPPDRMTARALTTPSVVRSESRQLDTLDTVDLTGSDDLPSSDSFRFGEHITLWTEAHASRPEPMPDKRGRKRKSDDMSHRSDYSLDFDDDEFPDVMDILDGDKSFEEAVACSTPRSPKRPRPKTPEPFNASPSKAFLSRMIGSQLSGLGGPLNKASSIDAPDKPSLEGVSVFQPKKADATETVPKLESACGDETGGGSVEEVAPHLETRPLNLEIQDSDDEWATPPTHHNTVVTDNSACGMENGNGPARGGFTDKHAVNSHIETASIHDRQLSPSKSITTVANIKRSRSDVKDETVEQVPPGGTQPLSSSQASPYLAEDTKWALLERFLATPLVMQRKRQLLERQLDLNKDAYLQALKEGKSTSVKEALRKEKSQVLTQQAALHSLATEYRSYEELIAKRDELLACVMDCYVKELDTDAYEARHDRASKEVENRKLALVATLLKAGIDELALFDGLDAVSDTDRPEVVPATPPKAHRPAPRILSGDVNLNAGITTETIRQPQVSPGPPGPVRPLSRLPEASSVGRCSVKMPVSGQRPVAMSPMSIKMATWQPPVSKKSISLQPPVEEVDEYDLDEDDEDAFRNAHSIASAAGRSYKSPQRVPSRQARVSVNYGGLHEEDEEEEDAAILQAAQDWEFEEEWSASAANQRKGSSRPVLSETSGNTVAAKQKMVPKRGTGSKSSKTSFPPELMRFPWSLDVKMALKDRFRMSGFRHNQLEAINATLNGDDAFVLMPTGGGKSLCYQLPALIQSGKTRGVTIVVSPLLSLMQDQVDHLERRNILAVSFNSSSSSSKRAKVMDQLRSHRPEDMIQLLYVSPEMIRNSDVFRDGLETLHKNKKLARLVIDEAHCVSQWGHDFRPDYSAIGSFRQEFPGVPIMALTATATHNVIADVKHNLRIDGCKVFSQSFNRPNLYYEVRRKEKGVVSTIAELIHARFSNQTGIVYTLSRKDAEKTADELRKLRISAAHYHASIAGNDKVKVQQDWQSGKVKVVVATIAFGMGIDKADVRFVMHQTLPQSLESYYQETGRAGRDGRPSECYLFFNFGDTHMLRKMINDGDGHEQQKERQRHMLRVVTNFADDQSECRRVTILRYFGEDFPQAQCKRTCDNCRTGLQFEKKDFTDIARAALEVVRSQRRLTQVQCSEILMGDNRSKHKDLRQNAQRHFGVAKHLAKHEVHRILDKLSAENALDEENIPAPGGRIVHAYFVLGRNAHAFLSQGRKLEVPIQVGASGKNAAASRSRKSTKARPFPPSTNVSSPVRGAARKGKGKAVANYGDDDDEDYEMGGEVDAHHRTYSNGYVDDGFVVDDDEDYDQDFDSAPPRRRSIGPPIAQDAQLQALHPLHQDAVGDFVSRALKKDDEIKNSRSLRQPLFTERQYRAMAMKWTFTLDKMKRIDDIDEHKVDRYGKFFIPMLQQCHQGYLEMTGSVRRGNGQGRVADQSCVDLVSDDDEDMAEVQDDDEEEGDDGDDGEPSRFFEPTQAAKAWHKDLEADADAEADPPRGKSKPSSAWRTKGSGRGGGKRAYPARSSGGAITKKKAGGKRFPAGSSSFASGNRARGDGAAQRSLIELMPH